MSQKLAASLAVTILFMVISAVGFIFVYDPNDFAEVIGGVLAPLLASTIVSLFVGFIGAAIRKNAFRTTFFWSYVVFLPIFTILMILGGSRLNF